MRERPLLVPVLLDPSLPTSAGDSLPLRPTHIASWTTSTPSGPSRRVALADEYNNVWIHSSPYEPPSEPGTPHPASSPPIPTINTPRTTSSELISPKRPSAQRASSFAAFTQAHGRDRSGSSASSIKSTRTSSSSRFTPLSPPAASTLPPAVVTSAIATLSTDSGNVRGTHRTSISEGKELRDHLREQRDANENSTGGKSGLGIGLGRRSLQVQSKDELESGSTSPTKSIGTSGGRSTASFDSGRTVSGIRGWLSREDPEKEREKELKERMEEVEVEREMVREVEEEKKEKEERKVFEKAGKDRRSLRVRRRSTLPRSDTGISIRRIVLPRWTVGKIARVQVLQDVGLLGVLRDVGLLDLFSLDSLHLVASISLEVAEPKNGGSSKGPHLASIWSWQGLHTASSDTSTLIVAEGVPWPCAMPSPNGEVTRVVMLSNDSSEWNISTSLELPGTGRIGVCRDADVTYILHFLPYSLTSYPVKFPDSRPETRAASSSSSSARPSTSLLRSATPSHEPPEKPSLRRHRSLANLQEEHPKKEENTFAKFLASRRAHGEAKPQPTAEEVKAGIREGKEVERDGYGEWSLVKMGQDGLGVGVGEGVVDVFSCDGNRLGVKGSIPYSGQVKDLELASGSALCIVTNNGTTVARLEKKADGSFLARTSVDLPSSLTVSRGEDGEILLATASEVTIDELDGTDSHYPLFTLEEPKTNAKLAAVFPSNINTAIVADEYGGITKQTLGAILDGREADDAGLEADRLASNVTLVKFFHHDSGDLVIAGDEDGVIRIWSLDPFELRGSWTVFADPVHSAGVIDPEKSNLGETLLCASQDGTVALISLEQLDLLYLIPASRAPLRRAFVDGKDILLAYANGKARVWNHQTCEFRRSTGLDAAEDMLAAGDWTEVNLDGHSAAGPFSGCSDAVVPGSDLSRLLELDLRIIGKWARVPRAGSTTFSALGTILSLLLTFDFDKSIDDVCEKKLGVQRPQLDHTVGEKDGGTVAFYSQGSVWRRSPSATGLRLLAIISLLRPFLDSPDLEQPAAEVISFYTTFVPSVEPGLDFFAEYYMDSAGDIHQAARMLFEARLHRMSEGEIERVVLDAESSLPSTQNGAAQHASSAALALTLVGGIAMHKYQSVNPGALKVAADSIFLYLSDPTSPHLGLAVELASKGFATWQTFLDPMDLLRLLFRLSTQTPPPPAISAQARLAVLHVASLNPALFMSTLSMDILDAKTVEGRTSIMKLCVFMARKRPAVLQNGLPRIAESVVRSLDPNVGKMREDVQETATVILNELVLAFSTIDFNSATQKLAVGTHEGAVVMYDLKTASRLYVLEPHKTPVSAVSFSADGRRLVTVSLESSDVTVWKVGSSLSGLFNVGGPPRQGGEKGEPFKRIDFIRADAGDGRLEEVGALSDVRIEWPAPKTCRVLIKETALTFET